MGKKPQDSFCSRMQAGCNIYRENTKLLLCCVGYRETLSGILRQVKSIFSSLWRGTPSPSTPVGHKPPQHSATGRVGVTAELLPRSQSQTPSPLCAAPVSSRRPVVKQRGQGWGGSSSLWPGCSSAMPRWVQVPSVGKLPCGEGKLQKEFLHGWFLHIYVVQKAEGHHLGGSPSLLLQL